MLENLIVFGRYFGLSRRECIRRVPELLRFAGLTERGESRIDTLSDSASFEALYPAFSRLKIQRTWEGILLAPMTITDVVLGEWVWAALKSTLSGLAILLVMSLLGLVHSPAALAMIPVAFLLGLAFAGVALVITLCAGVPVLLAIRLVRARLMR